MLPSAGTRIIYILEDPVFNRHTFSWFGPVPPNAADTARPLTTAAEDNLHLMICTDHDPSVDDLSDSGHGGVHDRDRS